MRGAQRQDPEETGGPGDDRPEERQAELGEESPGADASEHADERRADPATGESVGEEVPGRGDAVPGQVTVYEVNAGFNGGGRSGGRAPGAFFLVGLVAGALLTGLVWFGQARFSNDPGLEPRSPAADAEVSLSGQEPQPTAAAHHETSSTPLTRCTEVYAAQSAPLKAVHPALSQWEVHIGAMNKLVVGAITLAQANAFWNDTRIGARQNLQRFARALRIYDHRTARCPVPPGATGSGPGLRRCVEVVSARGAVIERATASMRTWRTHVAHMEMLRRGEMTPAEATALWLRSWRHGQHQVRALHSAQDRAEHAERSSGSQGRSAPCTA